jgi:hypothetical protein
MADAYVEWVGACLPAIWIERLVARCGDAFPAPPGRPADVIRTRVRLGGDEFAGRERIGVRFLTQIKRRRFQDYTESVDFRQRIASHDDRAATPKISIDVDGLREIHKSPSLNLC